ncbi:MAG TPA: VOC family protein [Pseudolabrys sp.]|nr:VOC family protein [Pseudolabrys sp.]
MPKPILHQINIVCGDVDKSIAFYRRLGVDVPDGMIWRTDSGAHHVSLGRWPKAQGIDLDLDSAAFAQAWNSAWKDRTDLNVRIVLGFHVETRAEVDAVYADMIAAGYRGLQGPADMFWGARYAIIEDTDGIAVGLMSPISPERKSPAPAV